MLKQEQLDRLESLLEDFQRPRLCTPKQSREAILAAVEDSLTKYFWRYQGLGCKVIRAKLTTTDSWNIVLDIQVWEQECGKPPKPSFFSIDLVDWMNEAVINER